MKRILVVSFLFCAFFGSAQFSQSDVIYYVGSGPDTALLVVDFADNTSDSSYAWGYLFDASLSVTASTMLNDIASDEPNLSVSLSGVNINEVNYNGHAEISGAPNSWITWNRTETTTWTINSGTSEILTNGSWFGCSYTDLSSTIEPGEPIPAYDSKKWSLSEIDCFIGNGVDTALLIIDFVNGINGEIATYSWGFLFDGTTTGEAMMTAIASSDASLLVSYTAGNLNNIIYNGLAGIGGSPGNWQTWSGTNLSDWTINGGVATIVNPGDWFGASYSVTAPRRPFYTIAALDASKFVQNDVDYWVGSGPDSCVFVIDFNGSEDGESFAFGYLFDGTGYVTIEDALATLSVVDPTLSIIISGGAVSEIVYNTYSGVNGSPDSWRTWNAGSSASWVVNAGITEMLNVGGWYGFSYSSQPSTPPTMPEPAMDVTTLYELDVTISVYPNPLAKTLFINGSSGYLTITDANGKVFFEQAHELYTAVMVDHLETGIYFVKIKNDKGTFIQKLVK